jgi:hypothetical protein
MDAGVGLCCACQLRRQTLLRRMYWLRYGCWFTTPRASAVAVCCRFGTVLENVVYDPVTREVNYDDG